jgi:hypothetical protein
MKQIITQLAILALALTALSCDKDRISPEELFRDDAKVAKTVIHTKSDLYEDTVTSFSDKAVYKKSEFEGKSHFMALSGGKMVYDAFMLSLYFDDIEKMTAGATLNPSRCTFSFFLSSDSNNTVNSYVGQIVLADKGDDYVILRFNNVKFNCAFGEYVTNGYLYCPLQERYSAE